MQLQLLLALALAAAPVAHPAEFSLSSRSSRVPTAPAPASRTPCVPSASVMGSGADLTRVEVACNADGSSTTTYSSFKAPSSSSIDTDIAARELQTVEMDEADKLVRTKDPKGSCTVGGDASCGEFQRCEAAAAGSSVERVCRDYCDSRRCVDGLACRLEPTQSCQLAVTECPPVAVCVAPDAT